MSPTQGIAVSQKRKLSSIRTPPLNINLTKQESFSVL